MYRWKLIPFGLDWFCSFWLGRWCQMRLVQCTMVAWVGWHTGAQMSIYSVTPGGAEDRRPQGRTHFLQANMQPATYEASSSHTVRPRTCWRWQLAASISLPTTSTTGKATIASISTPRYVYRFSSFSILSPFASFYSVAHTMMERWLILWFVGPPSIYFWPIATISEQEQVSLVCDKYDNAVTSCRHIQLCVTAKAVKVQSARPLSVVYPTSWKYIYFSHVRILSFNFQLLSATNLSIHGLYRGAHMHAWRRSERIKSPIIGKFWEFIMGTWTFWVNQIILALILSLQSLLAIYHLNLFW